MGYCSSRSKLKKFKKKDYDRLRPLSYPQTDLFVILFSIVDPNSIYNITEKWIPEISHHISNPKFIFVANKVDLLENEEEMKKLKEKGFIEEEMRKCIQELRGKYPETPYIETSCLTKVNLEEAMVLGVREVSKEKNLKYSPGKKDACFIN
jgi:GTPase SAR1 family protein